MAGERIRPLFLAPFGELGGSEMMLLRVVRALDERFESRAMVLTPGPLGERLRAEGVPTEIKELPGKAALLRFPALARSTARELSGERISFIHANQAKAAIFGIQLARRLDVPLLWMKHDHVFDGRMSRAIGARCDRVVCVSRAMASQFHEPTSERVSVAYPGVALPAVVRPPAEAPHVVAVGRLDPAKGSVELLHAVALLRERGIDVHLTVAGPADRIYPEHAEELRALVKELELTARVHVGWIENLGELYGSARVVALASRERPGGAPSEGAPTVLMEGMAHGRPVVAPLEAGIAEVVGDCGTLVSERTPAGFADALEPYLCDRKLAAEVGRRGSERAERLFSFERTMQTLTGLYEELSGAASIDRRGQAAA